MPRFYCPMDLTTGTTVDLPATAARHVQVLRLQPGDALTLFNGQGGEFGAVVARMGRSDVQITVGAHLARESEPGVAVHLAVGMPANDRMDWLVEKATELGVASVQPLMTAHSVLRLKGERADKKQAHWQAVAVAACEQCGRNRVPTIHAVADLDTWLARTDQAATELRLVLSLGSGSQPLVDALPAPAGATANLWFLNGPEGGLSPTEDAAARAAGWRPASLGPRVLRAETAALAALTLATAGR